MCVIDVANCCVMDSWRSDDLNMVNSYFNINDVHFKFKCQFKFKFEFKHLSN
jgi:hypothetical protein